ncbi:MAG TPA: SatD family protein [Flavobacterium sp.]|jgi:hypothetical protein|uniref:SatD family protein n=1 Tax=Flavobacterium sp. TaxID=239 RepID=UPI002B929E6F|nr:SatD family protein [Flavobacterium sp.]MCA0350053.1 SatD family protein [Bacteroidota bacterium]HPW97695.1 SatD family protein [Flavobacterium sp.]HQA74574.1 SatD family protein [Flavobacterium sp.]
MHSIITGDIIGSRKSKSIDWIDGLKVLLSKFGSTPKNWEIYRGDEFQLEINDASQAIAIALQIKAFLKSIKLDARMSIGIGSKTYTAQSISESNGSAFVFSGEGFNRLKKNKINLSVNSEYKEFNTEINLMLRLGLTFMDNWTAQLAEYVLVAMQNPDLSQEEIGQKLGINQAAVSRRRKRANFDVMLESIVFYIEKTKQLK